MSRHLLTTLLVLLPLVFSTCSKKYRLHRSEIVSEGNWSIYRGGPARPGKVVAPDFAGKLDILWTQKLNGKPVGPLAIHNQALVIPESRKRIRFYDLLTGAKRGRVKAKGRPQSGVALVDSLAFFALSPNRDLLRAYDLVNHKQLWKRPVKDACFGPIILDNRLLISSGDSLLIAFSFDGSELWSFHAEEKLFASATFGDGKIFQPADRGVLYALAADNGEELYRVKLAATTVSPVLAAKLIYVTDVLGNVYAVEPDDGSLVWTRNLGSPIWTSAAGDHDRIFVAHSGGQVVALDAADGHELWSTSVGAAIKASPLVVGKFVAIGATNGKVLLLNAADGTIAASARVKGAIEFPPVSDGRRLIVATQAGKIVCFGEKDEPDQYLDSGVKP